MTDSEKLDLIIDTLNKVDFTRLTTRLVDGEEVFITEKSLDGLGRLTIPKAIRRELNIDENTRLKIFRGQDKIIIKKG